MANSVTHCFSSSSSSSLYPPPPSSSGKSRIIPIHFHCRRPSSPFISKLNRGVQFMCVSSRRSYVSSLSAHQASSPTNNDVEALIKAYKQALSNGDELSVTEIETVFCEIEKEKNRFDHKVLSLSMKIASEKDTKIRLQADFDNTRKKLDKDRLSTESNAKLQIMKSLLPLIDSFESARQQIKPDTEMEKKIDTSYQGIYRQFVEVLRHLRVKAIPTLGKPFDPLVNCTRLFREKNLRRLR
ncbi:uncharacterized protein LOC130496066 isoform X2 [Raphanus sativus]|uniref:Uncharacterized protein LOC108836322 isoform X2 n=1 Tax=Raphanus sativus TaxID=3726 RepID=A0A6J0LZ56_RAPSA|nr:uncharacterized protein LOC108836322 isoform X2 [Raphanus sativus]XP_056843800.1 uncharacterized protein LOC130496066 isoform X2 [Raphanus sativus]